MKEKREAKIRRTCPSVRMITRKVLIELLNRKLISIYFFSGNICPQSIHLLILATIRLGVKRNSKWDAQEVFFSFFYSSKLEVLEMLYLDAPVGSVSCSQKIVLIETNVGGRMVNIFLVFA